MTMCLTRPQYVEHVIISSDGSHGSPFSFAGIGSALVISVTITVRLPRTQVLYHEEINMTSYKAITHELIETSSAPWSTFKTPSAQRRRSMHWNEADGFKRIRRKVFAGSVGHVKAFVKEHDNLSVFWIMDAGHLLPADQLDVSVLMLHKILT